MNQLSVNGGHINYILEHNFINRPYLVFLHDSLGCVTTWRDFPHTLAQSTHCNLLIYDRHGYGLSDPFILPTRDNDYLLKEAHILNNIIERLDIYQPILFGHSDGGTIALLMASIYPQLIKAIITEGAHIFVEDITINGIQEAKQLYVKSDLKEKLMKYHGEKTEACFNAWVNTWLSPAFADWRIDVYLHSAHCPAKIIQGHDDTFGSMAQVEGIIENYGGEARPCLIENCGHSPHKEARQEVLDFCQPFISKVCEAL